MSYEDEWRESVTTATTQRRNEDERPDFLLIDLDPVIAIAGTPIDDGLVAEPVVTCGDMRETCPNCAGTHLQLVLLQKHVRIEHLFCPSCTRCFEPYFTDGTAALNN